MTTIYGGESENCCAICNLHHRGLTAKQMRQRECLNKQCWHLEKMETHQYWKQREVIKQARAARKEKFRRMIEVNGH